MSYQFTVSPDFTPDHLSGWYIFNTWLQKQTDSAIHLEMYPNFMAQRAAIEADQVDIIYANPFDAAMLVREKGFRPLVKALGAADEAIIAVNAEHNAHDVSDLQAGARLAMTEDPDVHMMGMIMLEAADLSRDNVHTQACDSYVLVAKQLLKQDADVGIFLADAFDGLSAMIKKQLRVLVRSQIDVIHHSLLIGPKLVAQHADWQAQLLAMHQDPKGAGVLESLGFQQWQLVNDEDMEFMIDLMDTLVI